MQMAGGNALSRRLSEAAALDEAKAAKLQAQYEVEQEAALQKKRKDAQQQQQLLMRTRQQQVAPLATACTWQWHSCVLTPTRSVCGILFTCPDAASYSHTGYVRSTDKRSLFHFDTCSHVLTSVPMKVLSVVSIPVTCPLADFCSPAAAVSSAVKV